MSAERTARPSLITWIGLFIALFGMVIVGQVVKAVAPERTISSTIAREAGMWLVGLTLLVIVKVGERKPLSSIGIGTARFWRSTLWGFLLGVVCLAVAIVLVAATGYTGGEGGKFMQSLPLLLVNLIVIRAGVVEEICYRGYAIERLSELGLPRSAAAAVPLVIFAVAHWTGGWANIVIALVLGGILAAFYLWRRDLVANMIGHWLVDFIGNVVPRLFR